MTSQPPLQGAYWRSQAVGMCVSIPNTAVFPCAGLRKAGRSCVLMYKLQRHTHLPTVSTLKQGNISGEVLFTILTIIYIFLFKQLSSFLVH
jgi:hypothetical protein